MYLVVLDVWRCYPIMASNDRVELACVFPRQTSNNSRRSLSSHPQKDHSRHYYREQIVSSAEELFNTTHKQDTGKNVRAKTTASIKHNESTIAARILIEEQYDHHDSHHSSGVAKCDETSPFGDDGSKVVVLVRCYEV